jgi:integrase/recombinase XerD
MPATLTNTISKIQLVPNSTNASLITDFHKYMVSNGASQRHQNNTLKRVIAFAKYLGPNCTFYDLHRPEQIIAFLDTKIKSESEDPDRRWITTWNDYLVHIKLFLRWLHNCASKNNGELSPSGRMSDSDWETPPAARIKKKKTKRESPYSGTEIWDREELFTIIKYEPEIRNKAILALLWDLDARNHEITSLKIGNIRLRERYAEGEIPANTKTGGGPILLTCSFPYVRDWLNKHPFKNTSEARLICNLQNGAPIKPEALWTMMKQLRHRITQMLEAEMIDNIEEKQKLEYLLRTKKWNPYCLRHSAITYDSDYLPEYAVKKKARWSMNSRQGSRYIKSRMGGDLKRAILTQNGIALGDYDALRPKPAVHDCPRCNLINSLENKYCSKCSYPLVPDAFDEIKEAENSKLQILEEKHRQQMKELEEKMEQRFNQVMYMLQQNPVLAHVKPEVLTKRKIE